MAEYASLYVGTFLLDSYRNSSGAGSLIFTESNIVVSREPYYVKIGDYEGGDEVDGGEVTDATGKSENDSQEGWEGYRYQVTAAEMIDRLELLGYNMRLAEAEFSEGIQALREEFEGYEFIAADDNAALFDGFTFETWKEKMAWILRERPQRVIQQSEEGNKLQAEDRKLFHMLEMFSHNASLFGFPNENVLTVYRAVLDMVPTDTPVVLDFSILVGWVGPEDYACYPPKVIILTEGSSDKLILEKGLELLYPHLFDYFSFLNFDAVNMPGSAGQLLNVVRAFAGTGIGNPIVALFDNDTAGRDAMRQLNSIQLPLSMKVMALPDLELAKAYPTKGPQGDVRMDVNGLAASIELYLGRTVLTDSSGDLTPVQWTGYNLGMKQYQGEILNKSSIQESFRRRVNDALQGGGKLDDSDWSGLRLILRSIFKAFEQRRTSIHE